MGLGDLAVPVRSGDGGMWTVWWVVSEGQGQWIRLGGARARRSNGRQVSWKTQRKAAWTCT